GLNNPSQAPTGSPRPVEPAPRATSGNPCYRPTTSRSETEVKITTVGPELDPTTPVNDQGSPAAGEHSNASPSAPAASANSPKPHSCSPESRTSNYAILVEITSLEP